VGEERSTCVIVGFINTQTNSYKINSKNSNRVKVIISDSNE
jgi:hypothetical protein